MSAIALPPPHLVFPDGDGQPTADNTLQYEWISLIKWNVEADLRDNPDVFVAGDNLIYPNPTDPTERQAPDVYVAFGRPKGHRGSYKLWEEGGVFPQVIFEVWSPNNTADEMDGKRQFYEGHGAEEFYLIYPDHPMHAEGWVRQGDHLVKAAAMDGFVSPRLGVRFELKRGRLKLFAPDGREMKNPDGIAKDRDDAERRAAAEQQRAKQQEERAKLLADKLRELGVDPDAVK